MQQPIGQNDPATFATARENQYFDRKSARIKPNDAARHIVAFANAAGGKLAIGIEDDGEVTGFRRSNSRDIEDFRHAPLACCEPVPVVRAEEVAVTNSRGEDDLILVLDIRPSTDHVIARRSDGAVFLRQGDRSVVLGHDRITALEYDKNQRRFEDEVADRSSIDDVDPEVMARYKEELGTDVPDEQVLRSRSMLVDGHLTNTGVLLFAKHPTQFIPCARVRVVRLDGSKMETGRRFNIVKDRTFDGPLPKVIEGAKAMISEQLREFQYLGDDGRFRVIPEYPEFAWFEGLVNAVTHRNYAHSGDHIRVMMYDDRMEILSPGKLPTACDAREHAPHAVGAQPHHREDAHGVWLGEGAQRGRAAHLRRDGELLPERARLRGAQRRLGPADPGEQHHVARAEARGRPCGRHRTDSLRGAERVRARGHAVRVRQGAGDRE